jgi:hypothetical protein
MNIYQKILRQARKQIANGEAEFICWAIDDVSYWDEDPVVVYAGERIKEFIEGGLNDWHTLEMWLRRDANIPDRLLTRKNMKAYRLRYIDHLMEVFKNVK